MQNNENKKDNNNNNDYFNNSHPSFINVPGKFIPNPDGSWDFIPNKENNKEPNTTSSNNPSISSSSFSYQFTKHPNDEYNDLTSKKTIYKNFKIQLIVFGVCFLVLFIDIISIFVLLHLIYANKEVFKNVSYLNNLSNIAILEPLKIWKDGSILLLNHQNMGGWLFGVVITEWIAIFWSVLLLLFDFAVVGSVFGLIKKHLLGDFSLVCVVFFSYLFNVIYVIFEIMFINKKIKTLNKKQNYVKTLLNNEHLKEEIA